MSRALAFAALALVLAVPGRAQDPIPVRSLTIIGEEPRGAEMAPPSRLFEIRDGSLWLDGRRLPPEAVPEGIDLSGVPPQQLELIGPVIPVVEVDGVPFVLEDERLIPFSESSKAGNAYIMGEAVVVPSAAPEERLEPIVNEAYRRRLSQADQELLAQMEQEVALERQIEGLALRIRSMPAGEAANALSVDLRQRLGSLFDLKQEIRAEELRRAEAELTELKDVLEARTSLREDIIHHRFLELLGESAPDR